MTREAEPVRIEITEDSSAGTRVRLHNNGRFPDVLSGIPRHIVRSARPWLWNSYERRVIKAAASMSWQSRRLVRNILIAERARALVERNLQPKRAGWIARRRNADAQRAATREKLSGLLPTYQGTRVLHVPAPPSRSEAADRGQARSAGVPSSGSVQTREATARAATPATAGERDRPSLVEDVLTGARTVAAPPQARSGDRDQELRPQPERRLNVAALLQPEGGRELSLVERMVAGSALDSVRAMPVKGRAQAPQQEGHSDRSELPARTSPEARPERSR